jgi:hypothetical protein
MSCKHVAGSVSACLPVRAREGQGETLQQSTKWTIRGCDVLHGGARGMGDWELMGNIE